MRYFNDASYTRRFADGMCVGNVGGSTSSLHKQVDEARQRSPRQSVAEIDI